ncbi:hypothetical protein HID58_029363 [Brassica napus]|uniref:Uncharacterized protein n=1 Tax=Brassica napus TaxID=3708 RepID=A0ABQ8CDW2_BRANA|nr:hypothetical protein HID58_029363 [Brassica napus]
MAEISPSLIWNRPSQSPSGFLLLFLAGHMILAADQPPCPVDRLIFRNTPGTKNVLNLFLDLCDWSLLALFPHHRCAPPTLSLPVWKNPHGVSPKEIRREYPLLVSSFVGEGDA